MDRAHINECLMTVAAEMTSSDPEVILEMLICEYMLRQSAWPEETKKVVILVLAALTKYASDVQNSSAEASSLLVQATGAPH